MYVAHACELRQKRISVPELPTAARHHAAGLTAAAGIFWLRWLDYIL